MQTLHSLGANDLIQAPCSEPTAQGREGATSGARLSAAVAPHCARASPARLRPPRVGTYSGRGGGGLRAVAGGVDSCSSAGIWDRAVPRRPGEWRCGTRAGAVGCGSTVPRARLRAEAPPVGLGGSGRRPTAHPAAFVQRRLSPATLRARWLSRLFK